MSSIWNNRISVSMFGEADGPAIGVTIDNLPSGEYIDAEEVVKFMSRRSPKNDGTADVSRLRRENPAPRIMSGVKNERTTGTPLCAFIQNPAPVPEKKSEEDVRSRRGHADYTGAVRYRGFADVLKSGKFSEKLTVPLCFAGAVCGQILERRGIYTGGHIMQVHNIKDNPFDTARLRRDHIISIRSKNFPVINDRKGWLMCDDIRKAGSAGESLGGIIECASVNVPAGVGSPVFNGLENSIAQLVFGIPFVTGLEFGSGFAGARMLGSQNSDDFYTNEYGYSVTKTNNHGGIIGGISSGMPIVLKVAVKPSICGNESYSPCAVPRLVPCVESAVNIALLSHMIDYPNFC